jgi:hypothetical protein
MDLHKNKPQTGGMQAPAAPNANLAYGVVTEALPNTLYRSSYENYCGNR